MDRFDATLNNVSLSQLDPAVVLIDIDERAATLERETARRSIHPGTRISALVRRSLSVTLRFAVRAYDIDYRAHVLDMIAQWAGRGGWLRINSRPGQRLRVTVDEMPSVGSSLRWTDELTMTLTAYERPYWEQEYPVRALITDSGSLRPRGTYPTAYVECEITNAGNGVLTEAVVRCAETSIKLTGVAVPAGEKLCIAYTDKDVLTITAAGVSALANRTAESHDDLVAATLTDNDISVTADQPVSAVFSARGRYW